MLGVFITLSQSLCLGYRGIYSIIWPQSTGGGSPQTFLCICSLKMCICNFHTFALKPVAFLPPILSTGMEALFPIFLHVILPGVSTTLPISAPVLALLIAYTYDRHYAPSTLNTYVAALGFCHKPSGFFYPT